MASGGLRPVGDPFSAGGADIDVILVPGVNTRKSEDWRIFSNREWLPKEISVQVWTFDHHLQLNDSFSLARLLEPAGRLLDDCLSLIRQQNCNAPRPILIVSHSLGGCIVKQALNRLNAQLHLFSSLKNAIIGLVYMGTLHGAHMLVKLKEKCLQLVRSLSQDLHRRAFLERLENECYVLEHVAIDYERNNLHIPTLSIFEQRETRILDGSKKWRGQRRTSQILIDRELAKVNAADPLEKCLGFETDHMNICDWLAPNQNGSPVREAKNWISERFLQTQARVQNRSYTENLPVSKMEELSLDQNLSNQAMAIKESEGQPARRTSSASTHSPNREAFNNLSRSTISVPARSTLSRAFPQRDPYVNSPTRLNPVVDIASDKDASGDEKGGIIPLPRRFMLPRSQRPAVTPCFMVEERLYNKSFFGRTKQLQILDEALLPPDQPPRTSEEGRYVAMYGLPGVGKSELAAQYAFEHRDKFDAVFWIRADTVAKMDLDFSKIASELNLLDPDDEAWGNASVSRELSKSWLAYPTKLSNPSDSSSELVDATWLLIFDNASNPSQLQDYWPLFGAGSILITTRDPILTREFSNSVTHIHLKPFDDQEAAEFLRKRIFNNPERGTNLSLQIAKRLGGHPLALVQMAGVISDTMMNLDEFLGMYDNMSERQELLGMDSKSPSNLKRGSIASMWAADQLTHPGAKVLLELSSMLDPDGIHESILTRFSVCTESFPEYPATRVEYVKARKELLRASLLQRHEEASDKKLFSMHRVVRDVVRNSVDPQRMQKLMMCAAQLLVAVWSVSTVAERDLNHHWQHRTELYPHVVSLKELFESNAALEGAQSSLDFVQIISEAGWLQFERGTVDETKPLLESALAMCMSSETLKQETESEKPHVWHDTLSDIRYGLGSIANEGNDGPSCLEHNKILLELQLWACEKRGGPDLRLAIAHNQIGTGWMMDNDFDKAIKAFKASIETYKSLEDYWKCMESVPVVNLGQAQWLLGDLEAASKTLEHGLRDREEIFGFMDSNSFRTGRFLHALGNVRWDQAKKKPDEYEKYMDESESYHRRALVQYTSTIKNNHRTADVCHRVAKHCIRRKNFSDASSLLDQALKIWDVDPSRYVPERARSTFLKAKVARSAGDSLQAQVLVREASALRSQLYNVEPKISGTLEEKDFDVLVTFWSK